MKPIPASLLALTIGWSAAIGGLAAYQFATTGRTSDIGVMAIWTALFALLGWALLVAPFITRVQAWRLASGLPWVIFGWSIVAMVAFTMLVGPLMGPTALEILWYPALMGAIAGAAFALLLQRDRRPNA